MTHSRRSAVLLTAAAVASLLVGCGGSSSDGSSSSGATTTVASGADSADITQAAERVAGRYAHYDVVAYESADMKTLIISYGFTDLDVVDGKLEATESFCSSEHRSDQPIETKMSDAATSAIKPPTVAVQLSVKDGKAVFNRPETPTGIGIRLADPANDVLPTDPNDPRIADDDNDGKPGVTVHIKVTDDIQGDLYIARRERFAYDVSEQDDKSLTGTVTDNSEQLIIGATDPIFITKEEWVQVPDPSKNPIILKPVDRAWDCTKLMAERDDLFPPTPEVDW